MTDTKNTYLENALKTGLPAKAAAVYVVLLEAGSPVPPKAIVNRTRLHRQYVYDALHELEARRLVVRDGEGRRIRYTATSPDRLLQEAEKTRLDALDGVRGLMKLYDRSPAGMIEIIRGKEACIQNDFELLGKADKGDFLDVIGGAGMHWVHMMKDHMEEFEALRKQKDVKIRYIGTGEDVRYNQEEAITPNESRILPGIGDIVNVVIRKDSVTFDIYEPEIMQVVVKNKNTAKSQRALFEVLWAAAK